MHHMADLGVRDCTCDCACGRACDRACDCGVSIDVGVIVDARDCTCACDKSLCVQLIVGRVILCVLVLCTYMCTIVN